MEPCLRREYGENTMREELSHLTGFLIADSAYGIKSLIK